MTQATLDCYQVNTSPYAKKHHNCRRNDDDSVWNHTVAVFICRPSARKARARGIGNRVARNQCKSRAAAAVIQPYIDNPHGNRPCQPPCDQFGRLPHGNHGRQVPQRPRHADNQRRNERGKTPLQTFRSVGGIAQFLGNCRNKEHDERTGKRRKRYG